MEQAPVWLSYSLVYLAAAVLAVPLFKAIGLGPIIGYLAAGMAIGPWGLRLVSNVDDILHFAEFGVVLMLFLVGLELEPRRLWSLRRPIFGWGSTQLLACAAALAAAAMAFGTGWRTALVAALGLALSSTAMALQTLQERSLQRTTGGQAGFSILLFQDVAAIPILALVPLLGGIGDTGDDAGLALEAARVVAAIAVVILGGRLLLRPVLRWIAKSKTPEIFTAAALLLVVGIAALMQAVGLSMALGAFLAGVLLAESEYRRELETDLEPFKGLLLGLFFMAVGMSIDFGVLLASPGRMLAVLLGFMLIKLAVIWALARAHFPQLQVVARARDVTHWYALRDRGIAHVQRELFESSLASARSVMALLGHSAEAARATAERFRSHNLALLEQMYPHHKDQAKLIALVKQGRQQLVE